MKATDKQIAYINSLMNRVAKQGYTCDNIRRQLNGATTSMASEMINDLKFLIRSINFKLALECKPQI